jgi:hypothetical protein
VFSSRPDGAKPWLPNWVTKRFIAARRAAGLPHFRLHDLRHFMATEMLAAGVPIATVSQRLSHARASTTLNVYAHSVPGGDRRAAETLAMILAANVQLPPSSPASPPLSVGDLMEGSSTGDGPTISLLWFNVSEHTLLASIKTGVSVSRQDAAAMDALVASTRAST